MSDMSLMKRYAEDCEDFRMRAVSIAWHENADYREKAFELLLRDCETAAKIYADPSRVASRLKTLAESTYAAEFMAQKEVA